MRLFILKETIRQLYLSLYYFIDFILLDYTITTPFRKFVGLMFWKFGKYTRIRKGRYEVDPILRTG